MQTKKPYVKIVTVTGYTHLSLANIESRKKRVADNLIQNGFKKIREIELEDGKKFKMYFVGK